LGVIKTVNDSRDTSFHQSFTEVEQKPKLESGKAKIRLNLFFMRSTNLLNGLEFKNHLALYDNIRAQNPWSNFTPWYSIGIGT